MRVTDKNRTYGWALTEDQYEELLQFHHVWLRKSRFMLHISCICEGLWKCAWSWKACAHSAKLNSTFLCSIIIDVHSSSFSFYSSLALPVIPFIIAVIWFLRHKKVWTCLASNTRWYDDSYIWEPDDLKYELVQRSVLFPLQSGWFWNLSGWIVKT